MFVYGTLLIEEIWMHLIGRIPDMYPALLEGYHRYQVIQRAYPGLWHQEGAQTQGMWVDGLSRDEISVVDDYEGEEYQKVEVVVTLLIKAKKQEKAMVYVRAPVTQKEWKQIYIPPHPHDPIPASLKPYL